jgi:hypothetical protein
MRSLALLGILLGCHFVPVFADPGSNSVRDTGLPYMSVMLVRASIPTEEALASLALLSTGGQDPHYVLPAPHGMATSLLESLAPLQPKILASAETTPTTDSATALEAFLGKVGITLRTKAVGIVGDRFKFWLGIQRTRAGDGPLEVLERISAPVELTYGEALVSSVGQNLYAVAIPGAFESQEGHDSLYPPLTPREEAITRPEATSSGAGQFIPPDTSQPPETRIIWDAAPGTALPDEESLERILGE